MAGESVVDSVAPLAPKVETTTSTEERFDKGELVEVVIQAGVTVFHNYNTLMYEQRLTIDTRKVPMKDVGKATAYWRDNLQNSVYVKEREKLQKKLEGV